MRERFCAIIIKANDDKFERSFTFDLRQFKRYRKSIVIATKKRLTKNTNEKSMSTFMNERTWVKTLIFDVFEKNVDKDENLDVDVRRFSK